MVLGLQLPGGNFFQGIAQGLLVGGLNHAAHSIATNPWPDGRMVWELSEEELELLSKPRKFKELYGVESIELTISEGIWMLSHYLGLASHSGTVVGLGQTVMNSNGYSFRS